MRFLHSLLSDYHSAFAAEVDVPLGVLKEVAASYFALHAVCITFAVPAKMPAELALRTEEEERVAAKPVVKDERWNPLFNGSMHALSYSVNASFFSISR